jgi:hypothetical protein
MNGKKKKKGVSILVEELHYGIELFLNELLWIHFQPILGDSL